MFRKRHLARPESPFGRLGYGAVMLALLLTGCAVQTDEEAAVQQPVGLPNGSFFAELNGFHIHYEIHGDGPVVMAVTNSWGIDVSGLRAVYRLLEERATMVYFDPRGMGQSEAVREDADMGLAAVRADFDALRRHLGLEKVHAIGWSNGAMNLVLLASELPDTLESAIFLHGAASYTEQDMRRLAENHPQLMKAIETLQAELRSDEISEADKAVRMRRVWIEEFFPLSCADPQAARPLLRRAFADARFSWRHADYSSREPGGPFDARERLGSITARSLILAGAHDTMPVTKSREMHEGIPDSRLVVFENSGHFAPLEEPEAFTAAVFDFLGI